jgi:cation diffusion facilitator family transporter
MLAVLGKGDPKATAAAVSVVSNTLLTLGKLVIGLFTGSVSVLSEAIHSGIDLLAALIAWVAVRGSGKPADHEHPFGHGKYENLSGAIEAILIFVAAVWIIFEAIRKFLDPGEMTQPGLAFWVMLVSSVVNVVVSQYLFRVGRKYDSQALLADAWHLRTDVYTSAGVMVAMAVIVIVHWFFPGVDVHWIDPAAAIVVALLILKASWDLTMQAARDLVDSALPADEVDWLRGLPERGPYPVRSLHDLRTRKSGSQRFVEFHLTVPAGMTVQESHDIAEQMEAAIDQRFPGAHVTVHIEPCSDRDGCEGSCRESCVVKGS